MKTTFLQTILAVAICWICILPSVNANEEDFAPVHSLTLTAACREPYRLTTVTATATPSLDRFTNLELTSAAGKLAVESKRLSSITAPQFNALRLTQGISRAGAATLHIYIPFGNLVPDSGSRFRQLVVSVEGSKLTDIAVKTPIGAHDYRMDKLAP
jgi:hypothetical protein